MPVVGSRTRLLAPEDVPPSGDGLRVIGAFNPGAALVEDRVVLIVRVAEQPAGSRSGMEALPRWEAGRGVVTDWVPRGDVETIDARVVRLRATGRVRLTSVSHLRVVFCGDGYHPEVEGSAALYPETDEEEYGIEDARITRIGDRYWVTYVAVSRHGAATALASTADFRSFERHGIIFPPENKDVVIFPGKPGGRYAALHRPVNATGFSPPEMWLGRSDDLLHWGEHLPLHGGTAGWESGRVGAGAPPIRTEAGWLEIYHGSASSRAGGVGTYHGGAMLLSHEDRPRVLALSSRPILEPDRGWERRGFVPDVVFPTGIVEANGRLLIYYGAADTSVGVLETTRDSLLQSLTV